ncbi:hypothetical protein ABTP69_19610, partial [Acinetobacter baumannii]
NLKTVTLGADDVAAMEHALATVAELGNEDRYHLHFAIGKALEDMGEPERAFAAYATANALRRTELDYDPDVVTALVD